LTPATRRSLNRPSAPATIGGALLMASWSEEPTMDPVAITIGIGWIAVGLISIGLAVPLVQGKVRRNALYGMRFPQSFQSDAAWFAINRYGARRLMIWALPMM